jgi:hypothetical protein
MRIKLALISLLVVACSAFQGIGGKGGIGGKAGIAVGPSIGHAAPTIVSSQTVMNTGTATSISATFGSNVTAANGIMVFCLGDGSITSFTPSDSEGNTFTDSGLGFVNITGSDHFQGWVVKSASGGTADVVTCTPSASTDLIIFVQEINGQYTTAPVDCANTASAATVACTTANATDLIISMGGNVSGAPSAGSGTDLTHNCGYLCFEAQYQTSSATGSQTATWGATNVPTVAVMMALQ